MNKVKFLLRSYGNAGLNLNLNSPVFLTYFATI
jgi:hypothetical protein